MAARISDGTAVAPPPEACDPPAGADAHVSARNRIFNAARAMFYQKGIRAVGVESIAAEAGATKMTLYRNFTSKDELVAECLRDQSKETMAWWDEIVAPYEGDPRAQLEALFDTFAAKTCINRNRGCPLGNAAIELDAEEHPARQVAVDHKREMHRRLLELTMKAGARDDILADALMMLIDGAYLTRVTLGEDGPVRHVAVIARELFQSHLGPRN
jgi:AcrR family transcriptional regulator